MKTILKFACICLALFSACVEQDNPSDDGTDNAGNSEKYSVRLPISVTDVKQSWIPGDQFVIHGEYSKDQLTYILTPEDISQDGKTCYVSVEGVTPFEQKTTKTEYYIAYPAHAVKNDSHCKESSKFTTTNDLLMAGYNKGKTFIMEPLIGGFSFTVSGDFDSYELKGNNNEVMGYGTLKCLISENTKLYAQSKGSAKNVMTGNVNPDGKSLNIFCTPDELKLSDGFSMTFFKGSAPVKSYSHEASISSSRSVFSSLGDFTSKLTDYKSSANDTHVSAIPTAGAVNLGVEETANCYMVTKPGVYSFKAVKGNSSEVLPYIGSVKILWESWGTTESVTPNSVIAQVDYEKDMVYFCLADDFHPGNAVIAVCDDTESVLWSWHIWVPQTEVEENLFGLSRHMTMDRNLGALVVAAADGASPQSAGLFYQWGRKDPFVGVGDFATGEPTSVAGQAMTLFGGQMTTAKSIKNPTAFANKLDAHWNESQDEYFWIQSKSMYDPCPPGYRIPYGSEYLPFSNNMTEFVGWNYDADANVLSVGNPITTYPLGGYITTEGVYNQYGEGTRVWSSRSTSNVVNAYNFRIFESDGIPAYGNGGKPKSNGFAVRCVRLNSTPFENAPGTPVKGGYKAYTITDLNELSGLCLSIDKSHLWGVGDQGEMVKLTFDGKSERQFKQSLDMEAITIDPATGDLYMGCESNWVGVVKAPDYTRATEIFRVADASDYGNSGVEGISWYKDNMLLVGTQVGANLWAYTLDGTVVWKKSLKTVAIGCQEIADICYDPEKDQIWIIDSESQCIYLLNGDASEHLATYKVNYAGNCESVCLDYSNNCVWIADDTEPSELFKIDFTF